MSQSRNELNFRRKRVALRATTHEPDLKRAAGLQVLELEPDISKRLHGAIEAISICL